MPSVSVLKNNNDQMVVSIDGNWYVLTLPDKQLFSHLLCFERPERLFSDWIANRSILLAQDLPHCQEVSVVEPDSGLETVCCSWSKDETLRCFVGQSLALLTVRPMLVPVKDDRITLDTALSVNPNGSIVSGGTLYQKHFFSQLEEPEYVPICLKSLNNHPIPKFCDGVAIGDTADQSEALEWICIDGFLISRRGLFLVFPREIYENIGLWRMIR